MIEAVHPCRVCLSEGTWNIFGSNVVNDEMCTVASINHIRDKLQYVTQLEINADDGLPFRICELCVVQLNLAYYFKQLAADSDSKLRVLKAARETPTLDIPIGSADEPVVVQEGPEAILGVAKQEREEESSNEITIGLTVVSEPSTDHYTSLSAASVSRVTPEPAILPAMVYLQRDIINPAEDEAFIKDIIKKEVISMPWPTITDCSSTPTLEGDQNNFSSQPQIKSPPKKKPRKSPVKRRRSASEHHDETNGIENRPQKQSTKVAKKRTKRATVVPVTTATAIEQNQPAQVKESSKSNKSAVRKRGLQKELANLRIDMVDERYDLRELALQRANGSLIAPMVRRNSICVSSLRSWM
ncbi:uncharacterized protein LOC126561088 [Anopheles maculipalpis]|uniref:uncharacterized protein LOC126561088 n=1 Tax=Anopheles maculipalpis TaxID=1496333 RepID=UPI002158B9A1|nr:uncharacterized protein LOC126561088 [Anopheles maculipalpis]